ncbi:MAG: hypothetical protein K2M45_01875, partial [Muribaculaceae bacterium]|nr:hypothetical protein [Muribaculaceae bacterium]
LIFVVPPQISRVINSNRAAMEFLCKFIRLFFCKITKKYDIGNKKVLYIRDVGKIEVQCKYTVEYI